jgi:hypothetical protein
VLKNIRLRLFRHSKKKRWQKVFLFFIEQIVIFPSLFSPHWNRPPWAKAIRGWTSWRVARAAGVAVERRRANRNYPLQEEEAVFIRRTRQVHSFCIILLCDLLIKMNANLFPYFTMHPSLLSFWKPPVLIIDFHICYLCCITSCNRFFPSLGVGRWVCKTYWHVRPCRFVQV